jgi:S-adenosylmethionine hydrolase
MDTVKTREMTKLSRTRIAIASLFLAGVAVLAGCGDTGGQAASTPKTVPLKTIGFMTDFDVRDDAVGICKAVMEGIAPGVKIIDITHEVTPYDIAEAARFLAGSAPYFAKDAVFVVVVDPTVGTSRKAIIAKSKVGQFFVLPDNGVLTLVERRDGIESAREITNPDWMIGTKLSSTFHGRDIFSPTAAHLARGDDWTTAGPALEVAKLVQLNLRDATIDSRGLHGNVIGTDGPFGNLVLNVQANLFSQLGYRIGDTVPVLLSGRRYEFPFVKTFGDVPVGKPLFYIDSRGRLSLGVNQRNFSQIYKVDAPAELTIPAKEHQGGNPTR